MPDEFFALMQAIAPDLAEQIERRALVLERIDALQPVGRRMLAGRLNLPEREVRTIAAALKDNGLVRLNAAGMTLTPKAEKILPAARRFSRELRGLTKMETALSKLLHVPRVYVAAGDADQDPHVLGEVGRLVAGKLRSFLRSGSTLAVTGGQTMLEVAYALSPSTAMNVMVVPARGGFGRALETQANTVASVIAGRLGGHHRLMHLPDDADDATMTELKKLSDVTETLELLQRTDVVLYGIGRAEDMGHKRQLSSDLLSGVLQRGAKAEAYGCYFNTDGDVVYSASSVSRDLGKLKPDCVMIAAAAGTSKAEAIRAVMNSRPQAMLVTDEGAARAILGKR